MMQGSTSDRCNMPSGSSGAARRTHVLGDITNTQGEQRRLQNNQPVGEECASVLNQNIKRDAINKRRREKYAALSEEEKNRIQDMEIQQKVDETVAPDHQISAPSDSCVSERDDGLEAAVISQHDGIPSTDTSVSPHGQDKCSSTKEQRKRKQVNVESKCLEHTEFAKDSAATEMHTSSNPTDCVDSDLNEDIVILNELSTADHASTGQCVSFESPKRAKTAKMTDSKLDIEPDETTQSFQLPTNKESKCLDDTIGTKDSAAIEMNTSSRPTDCVDSDINEDLVLLTGLSTVDDASTVECVSFDSPQKSKSAQMSDPKCDIQPNETTQPHQLPTKEVNNLTDVEVRHRHNKPKKAYFSIINEQDYICDEEDMNVIDSIRDSRDGRTVVKVDGHVIAFSSFKCLLNPTAFLDGEVINTYISLINSEPHLLVRDGLSVHITDSIQYQYLYNAGHHLVKQNVSNERILEWVSNYIQHDLVFIPINVPDSHWYLAVINAKKRQILVLDSLGHRNRAELAYAICGVQRYIDIASGILKDMDHKWPDLQVANWPFVEQFSEKMQRDGHSCGLFLLNFIEYWTGERLSDNIAQIHMSNFKLKLAAILLDTPLNTKRGCPDDDSSSESKKGDPDDCILLGDSKDSYKHAEHINGSTSKINAMKYVRVSGDIIDFLLKCTDPDALRLEWVRNTKPYPIAITLGMLQDLLRLEVSMSIDCFNFVVRMYSNEEATLSMDPLCYFADLQLSLRSNYRVWYGNRPKRDQYLLMNVFPDNLETGAAVIACDLVLVPFHFRGEYSIYCFDTKKRTITIVEATHKPLQTGVTSGYCRHYNDKIQKICRVFDHAMEIVSPEYNDDSYDWWRTIVHDPWLLGSREQTGFSVLLTMWFWDAKYKLKNAIENKDPMVVRKYFFTHVLTSKWNECTESIPDDILRVLRIENQRLAKCLFG